MLVLPDAVCLAAFNLSFHQSNTLFQCSLHLNQIVASSALLAVVDEARQITKTHVKAIKVCYSVFSTTLRLSYESCVLTGHNRIQSCRTAVHEAQPGGGWCGSLTRGCACYSHIIAPLQASGSTRMWRSRRLAEASRRPSARSPPKLECSHNFELRANTSNGCKH